MPEAIFEDPRLAAIYDPLDPDRSDLDAYLGMADEIGARSVLDVGCGTGSFALLLADRGYDVVAVDPSRASLDIARAKPGADRVRWLYGDATTLPPLQVELATMTGNVAQAIASDRDWSGTLEGIRAALRPDGRLIFETRDPSVRAWERWNRTASYDVVEIDGVGAVETWHDLIAVEWPFVTFRSTVVFASDSAVIESESTLRFRDRDEVERDLQRHGYIVEDLRDAPDRPGRELVFLARRP